MKCETYRFDFDTDINSNFDVVCDGMYYEVSSYETPGHKDIGNIAIYAKTTIKDLEQALDAAKKNGVGRHGLVDVNIFKHMEVRDNDEIERIENEAWELYFEP